MLNNVLCILFMLNYFVYDEKKDVKWYSFNTKTAYRNSKLPEFTRGNLELSKCTLVHISTVFRHGSRNPSRKSIKKSNHLFKKLNESRYRLRLPKELLNWHQSFLTKDEKLLSLVGRQEMFQIGQRIRKRFDLIPGKHNIFKSLKIFSTTKSRSKNSAISFLKGFFKNKKNIPYEKMVKFDDDHLRYFEGCDRYITSVVNNSSMKYEYRRFLHDSHMDKAIDSIQDKWRIDDVSLTPDDLSILYTMCGFEIANNISNNARNSSCSSLKRNDESQYRESNCADAWDQTSPLCSLFKKDHYEILDYLLDLKNYWIKAYGDPIIPLMSCKLMSPILNDIKSAMNRHKTNIINKARPEYIRGSFWFSHAETILPLIGLLNLFSQKLPMTADAFEDRLKMMYDPKKQFSIFRTTNITPFAANLGLELYQCPHYAEDFSQGSKSGYRIQVKVNEKAVKWSMAGGTSHMAVEDFLKNMDLCLPEKFNFDQVCKNKKR